MFEKTPYQFDMLNRIVDEQYNAACAQNRPSIMLKPSLGIDGNKWCALFGSNLAEGVAGFGDSPDEAYRDFDRAWCAKLPP